MLLGCPVRSLGTAWRAQKALCVALWSVLGVSWGVLGGLWPPRGCISGKMKQNSRQTSTLGSPMSVLLVVGVFIMFQSKQYDTVIAF